MIKTIMIVFHEADVCWSVSLIEVVYNYFIKYSLLLLLFISLDSISLNFRQLLYEIVKKS